MLQDIDLAELIADTEGEILRLVQDRDPSTHGLYEMVRYHLALDGTGASGGKRMRPLLGLLAYASIAGDHQRALPGAAAVELGHNFSLVHDDIEDGDTERRHRPTLWSIHGVPQAINAGDALFSLSRIALHRLTDLGLQRCHGPAADAPVRRDLPGLVRGPVHRYRGQRLGCADERGRLLRHDRAQDGAHSSRRPSRQVRCWPRMTRRSSSRYRAFGYALGLAFQLNDDLLGIWGAERATGKAPTDVANKKKTLPVIYAFEHAGPADRDRLMTLYDLAEPTDADVAEIVGLLEGVGAREYTRDEARRYRNEALAELDAAGVVQPAARARLEEIIVGVISA
ncbi:MAG: polyprenyl synthetase family protein [Candidatus Limnocylindrales bacterium]